MGTFYKNTTREFPHACLVLCLFKYGFKEQDSVMISVNKSSEILAEFEKHCKILGRRKPVLMLYLPQNGRGSFSYHD